MSQENVEIVRRIYAGLVSRPDSVQELFGPAYEMDLTHAAPDVESSAVTEPPMKPAPLLGDV
jgi:hypothetical protein